jgi:hypothetical protein
MGDPDDGSEPRDRAETDAELASANFAAASEVNRGAASLDAMAQNMTELGLPEMADVVRHAATQEHSVAVADALRGQHYMNASQTWSTTANDLDEGAEVRGRAYVGNAERMVALEPGLAHQMTPAELAHAAPVVAHVTAQRQEADALAHDADVGMEFAINEERRARGTYHPPQDAAAPEPPAAE